VRKARGTAISAKNRKAGITREGREIQHRQQNHSFFRVILWYKKPPACPLAYVLIG
jgi:hypothetical protein